MYYSTETIARAAGISPAAARYYLQQGQFTPQITVNRFPRHSRVYSWPESALAWVRSRVAGRPIGPAPDPLHWLSEEEASRILQISPSQLRRLVACGRIRSRRCLIHTKKGARWRTFIHATDAATHPTRSRTLMKYRRTQESDHLARPIILLRAWLILLGIEESAGIRALALFKPGEETLLINTEQGKRYAVNLDNPEGSPGLPTNLLPPTLTTDDWNTALAAFRSALQQAESGRVFTISADTIDIWSDFTTHRAHISQYALPIPAAHG